MSNADQPGFNGSDRTIVPVVRRSVDYPLAPGPDVLNYASPLAPVGSAHLLRRILQHKWTILVVALAIFLPCLALIWLTMKAKYRADGQIEVRPVTTPLVYDLGRTGDRMPYYHEFINNQVAVIRGSTVLNRVLDSPEVKNTHWYRRAMHRGRVPSIDGLREIINVMPAGRTTLITVSARTDRAQDAVTLVKTVLDEYIAQLRQSEDESSATMHQQLVTEYTNLQTSIHGLERQIDMLRNELGTGDPEELVAQQRKRVDEMQARMDELERTIKLAEWDVNQLRAQLGLPDLAKAPLATRPGLAGEPVLASASQPGAGPTTSAAIDSRLYYAEDLPWRTFDNEVRRLQQELTILRRSMGPSHPDILTQQDRIRLSEANLKTRQDQLDRSLKGAPAGGVLPAAGPITGEAGLARDLQIKQETLGRLQYERRLMDEHLTKQETSSTGSFERAQTLRTLLRDLGVKRELYEKVRSTLERRRIEQHLPASVHVMTYPYLPDLPLRDNRRALSVGALLLGLGVGVGVAFLRVKADPNIQEVQELTQSAPVAFLGQLPLVRQQNRQTLLDDPLLNEGVRMVRTPLLQRIDQAAAERGPTEGPRGSVVLITSAGPGDGKTTLSVLLARSLANCGRRVLLVDADLRNPSLASILRLDNRRGLMDVLSGQEEQDRHIVTTDVERLSVLPTGDVAGRADPELIANGRFNAAIERWRQAFDVVLLDSPPVLPVADARILVRHADGAILVVRAYQNQREDLLQAVQYLESAGGQLWGTVFVGAASRYYGYSAKYGYGYGARA